MQLSAILFDLDGTLLDSVSTILKSNSQVCASLGLPFDEVKFRSWIGIPLEAQARKLLDDRAPEYIDAYRKIYWQNQGEQATLFPGTLPMMDTLKSLGFKLALVTSRVGRGTQRLLDSAGILDKFDVIVSADDVVNPKPHPEPILKALDMLKITPEQAIYVGDSLFDIDSSQQAGVRIIGVSWGARSREDLMLMCPDCVCDTWDEFLGFVKLLK